MMKRLFLLLACLSVPALAWAQQTGPIGQLRGSTDSTGALLTNGGPADGADPTIRATVKDYTNSNPLAVIPVDTNGDAITDAAHDAVDSGNPVKIGFKAKAGLSGITLVSGDDRTDAFAGIDGAQFTRPHSPLEDLAAGVVAITDGSSTSAIAAAAAGVKYYITDYSCANTSATNVTVDIRDGTAGSVKWTFACPATGGSEKSFSTPLGGFTAATAIAIDPSAAASTVTVSIKGFKSKI